MTLRKVLARDIIVQIETAAAGVWVAVGGLRTVTFNLGANAESAEDTDYDSDGEYGTVPVQRGAAATLEGQLLLDDVSGAQDVGQARCETLATSVGYGALGKVRYRHPAQTIWRQWNAAEFELDDSGGGHNDLASWKCKITRSGASTTVAV